MASPIISDMASIALLVSVVIGLIRFYSLRLAGVYPSVIFFFACEFAIVAASVVFGVGTSAYAYSFGILVPLEWVALALVMRELYNAIFERYRGIQMLGRWSIYFALFATFALAIFGSDSIGHLISQRRTLVVALEFASGCLIFGSVVLVGLILLVISRYPMELHRNIVVNCRCFALFMLVEAGELLVDHLTARELTVMWNVVGVLLSAFVLLTWPMLLSREGEVTVFKLRRSIGIGEETRLLDQLNAFNSLLLRVVRK